VAGVLVTGDLDVYENDNLFTCIKISKHHSDNNYRVYNALK